LQARTNCPDVSRQGYAANFVWYQLLGLRVEKGTIVVLPLASNRSFSRIANHEKKRKKTSHSLSSIPGRSSAFSINRLDLLHSRSALLLRSGRGILLKNPSWRAKINLSLDFQLSPRSCVIRIERISLRERERDREQDKG
jgi:hypothetical protein